MVLPRGGDYPCSPKGDARVEIALSARRKIRPPQTCRRLLARTV